MHKEDRALPSWEERMQEEEDGKGEGAHVLLGRPTSDDLTILNGSEAYCKTGSFVMSDTTANGDSHREQIWLNMRPAHRIQAQLMVMLTKQTRSSAS